jgi:hypothetical protein
MRNGWRGNAQCQQYQEDRNHQPEQQKALLARPRRSAATGSGSV